MEQNEQTTYDADVIIIGGGPGGYVAALKLGMLGASVILIEKDTIGGTCLNRGCIPTKALLHSAELYVQAKAGAAIGVESSDVSINLEQVCAYKDSVVAKLVRGVKGLLKARKVQVIKGQAKFAGPKTIAVQTTDGQQKTVSAGNIIIATGSKAGMPPIAGIDGRNVITSTEALDVKALPGSLAVIGGGVIGMEIGSVYADFGANVTVIEAMERILPNMDEEISEAFVQHIGKKMKVYTSARVESISDTGRDQKAVKFIADGQPLEVITDQVLACTGRIPDTSSLDLESAGVATDGARVITNTHYETNVPGIYCIGDANGKVMLAHAASAQGIAVAQHIIGGQSLIKQDIVPSCVYTTPEIASVGITEQQAKQQGIAYKTGLFHLRANGRSLIMQQPEGFVKIIGGTAYNEVLGVHIMGPYATELIAQCAVVMKLEGCVDDIAHTIHAHPTMSESVMEAAEEFLGGAIHSL